LVYALSMILAIIDVCSRTLAVFGVKPFWISSSITSFYLKRFLQELTIEL